MACRICLDNGVEPLVQPCGCRGTMAYVHASCLARWRRENADGTDAFQCSTCGDQYRDSLTLELLRNRLSASREHGDVIACWDALGTLAGSLAEQGQVDEAVKLQTELYESICDHVGTTKPRALSAAAQLAGLLSSQGELAASEELARDALTTCRNLPASEVSHDTMGLRATLVNNLGLTLKRRHTLDEAEVLYREGLQLCREMSGDDGLDTCAALNHLGMLL